jgi:excinuclease ABC subunit C
MKAFSRGLSLWIAASADSVGVTIEDYAILTAMPPDLVLDCGFSPAVPDHLEDIPSRQGVFVIDTGGDPYINRSSALRRRVTRLLDPAPESGKRLNLRDTARAIWYRQTGSVFESNLLLWRLNRSFFPESYRRRLRMRPPVMVKLNWENEYPRCYLTRRLSADSGTYFGPFPSRLAADRFLQSFLDLFLIRRCVETIVPDPAHPGCMYGEMKMCLRPCQAATTRDAYLEESAKVRDFLATRGASLLRVLETEREIAAADLEFERASEIHKRLDKVKLALDLPDLVTDLERLHGIVIQTSHVAQAVELFPVFRGYLLPQITLPLAMDPETGKPISLDTRLREALAGIAFEPHGRRAEQLALLARWFYRGTRKGEFIAMESFERPAYRRLVNAIGRVARGAESVVE